MFGRIFEKKYTPLNHDDSNDDTDDTGFKHENSISSHGPKRGVKVNHLVIAALLFSILGNLLLLYKKFEGQHNMTCKSDFARLTKEISKPFISSEDDSDAWITEEEWESTPVEIGVVALSDEYVAQKNLPVAQRFPWDSSKGMYFLQSHHSLHCLKTIRNSLWAYRNQTAQTQTNWHVDHCMIVLREDIICHADDTPRVTGDVSGRTGLDQERLCKDWSKLETWAKENTACFIEPTPENPVKGFDQYKNCPDGSKPWEMFNLTKVG